METQTRVGMPMEDFIHQYEQAPFELVDGERIPLMPPVKEHGDVIRILQEALILFKQLHPHYVIYTEMPVVLEDTPDWVKGSRVPDLMIYDKARLDEYEATNPDHKSKPFVLIPDLCVEVISATDNYLDVDAKVEGYLRDGVRLVWVFNPRLKTIKAHSAAGIARLSETDSLDGGGVLPGFSLSGQQFVRVNVLLVSRCPPYPLHLGDRLIVYHLARQLAQRGHTLDLIAFSDRFEDIADRAHYADLFRQITIVADPPRTSLDYGLRLLVPPLRFPNGGERAWSPAMWNAIREHVEANHYDVAHLFGGIQVYEHAHAVAPLPAIITPYESYSLYLRRVVENAASVGAQRAIDNLKTRLQWRVARSFESWMFAPYRRVIVVSERDCAELRALAPALPLEVIPNGIDLDYFRADDTPREPNTLLFTGNYEYAPNVDAALRLARDIFPRVQAAIPGAKLWLVGSAPPPELQALVGDSPNGGAITVTGHVPDMRPYLRGAAVFVSPLRLGAGIKNKVLEALALACPVVATPVSVDGIAVRDGENILSAETDEQIVSAALRLLADPARGATLGANGRALIEARYSWAQVAARYEQVYAEVTS